MVLNNNLYKVVDRNDNSFRIELNTESLIYKAHFPEQPITPGVCIIQIASELLKILVNRYIDLSEVINSKFLSVINPLETKEVVYSFSKMTEDRENKTLKITCTVTSGNTVCAKLSLLYTLND